MNPRIGAPVTFLTIIVAGALYFFTRPIDTGMVAQHTTATFGLLTNLWFLASVAVLNAGAWLFPFGKT